MVKHLGRYVVAYSINDDVNPTQIKGKLGGGTFLTGEWVGKFVKNKGHYYGVFQFTVSPTGNKMEGKWIGFNRRHEIKEGNWNWTLMNRDVSEEIIRDLVTTVK